MKQVTQKMREVIAEINPALAASESERPTDTEIMHIAVGADYGDLPDPQALQEWDAELLLQVFNRDELATLLESALKQYADSIGKLEEMTGRKSGLAHFSRMLIEEYAPALVREQHFKTLQTLMSKPGVK